MTVAAPLKEPGIFIKAEAVTGNPDLQGLLDFAKKRREERIQIPISNVDNKNKNKKFTV